mmetsp:Transcript_72491/g.172818  ORF Transcript_72491/g.172818 Transcript_72491/m.172818 type:complete len:250 (+) Transcript_72491:485-1234(+)
MTFNLQERSSSPCCLLILVAAGGPSCSLSLLAIHKLQQTDMTIRVLVPPANEISDFNFLYALLLGGVHHAEDLIRSQESISILVCCSEFLHLHLLAVILPLRSALVLMEIMQEFRDAQLAVTVHIQVTKKSLDIVLSCQRANGLGVGLYLSKGSLTISIGIKLLVEVLHLLLSRHIQLLSKLHVLVIIFRLLVFLLIILCFLVLVLRPCNLRGCNHTTLLLQQARHLLPKRAPSGKPASYQREKEAQPG